MIPTIETELGETFFETTADDSPTETIEIPLDTITGTGVAGVIINDGQDESIFVEGNMANPLTVEITGIGGKGNTKWIRSKNHFARYTIQPVEVEISDSMGSTRLIIIDEILLIYRVDNIEFPSITKKNEEAKKRALMVEIPNFITEDESRIFGSASVNTNIGKDEVIEVGDEVIIELATNNKKTSENKEGEYTE